MKTADFLHDGYRLVYDDHGSGDRPFVLIPGLLLPRTMHTPLAQALAARGNRVLVLDPLGHNESDRPLDMSCYSMPLFAQQVIGLLDHLGIDEAVVGGTSLGANITLETLVAAPERVRGAVIEMPVLDGALVACALAFTPMMVAYTAGAPLTRLFSRAARLIPDTRSQLVNVGLDWARQDPGPSGAYLQGLFFGRIAPPRVERSQIETPSLVLGHPRDPIHPFSDADSLVHELRNARKVDASWIGELRLTPGRLTGEIARFVDDCWRPTSAPVEQRPRRAAGA